MCATEYGWTPHDVDRLTLHQWNALMLARTERIEKKMEEDKKAQKELERKERLALLRAKRGRR